MLVVQPVRPCLRQSQGTALRNYVQKTAAGGHPHSSPVSTTFSTQKTTSEKRCSAPHPGSEEGELCLCAQSGDLSSPLTRGLLRD